MNESEPLMTCRKANQLISKPGSVVGLGRVQTLPVYGLDGIRHGGGMILSQALVRILGTCRLDDKGGIRTRIPRKEKSTNAGNRTEQLVVVMKYLKGYRAKGLRHPVEAIGQPIQGGAIEFDKIIHG